MTAATIAALLACTLPPQAPRPPQAPPAKRCEQGCPCGCNEGRPCTCSEPDADGWRAHAGGWWRWRPASTTRGSVDPANWRPAAAPAFFPTAPFNRGGGC